jgi:hypothetical protein
MPGARSVSTMVTATSRAIMLSGWGLRPFRT